MLHDHSHSAFTNFFYYYNLVGTAEEVYLRGFTDVKVGLLFGFTQLPQM